MPYDTYEEIKKRIISIFVEYGVKTLPIDCFNLAKTMGFTLIPYSSLSKKKLKMIHRLSGGEGLTIAMFESEKKLIFFDDSTCEGRQRFTILHELGHYVLGHREESEIANAQANFFAKYAIAPLPIVHVNQVRSRDEIVEMFGTSKECAINVLDAYNKWLDNTSEYFTSYEVELLELFNLR